MSLLVILANVAITITASLLTWISYLFVPQYFEYCALTAAASVLFGTLYIGVSYIGILVSVSYLK